MDLSCGRIVLLNFHMYLIYVIRIVARAQEKLADDTTNGSFVEGCVEMLFAGICAREGGIMVRGSVGFRRRAVKIKWKRRGKLARGFVWIGLVWIEYYGANGLYFLSSR